MRDLVLAEAPHHLQTIDRLAGRLDFVDVIPTPSTALLRADDCRAMLAEAEGALAPCGMAVAVDHIAAMLAVFAAAGRDGAKQSEEERRLYVAALTAALAACPAHCARAVISDLIRSHRFGLPLPGDITARAEAAAKPIHRAAAIARGHLKEHARRAEKRRAREAEDARLAWSRTPQGRAAISAIVAETRARLAHADGGSP